MVGIITSPDVVREGYRREASLRHCGKNLYVSGWCAGGLGGKPGNLDVSGWGAGRLGGSQPTAHSLRAHHELNSVSRSNFK